MVGDHGFQSRAVVGHERLPEAIPLCVRHLADQSLLDADELDFDLLVNSINRDVLDLHCACLDLRDGSFGNGDRRIKRDFHVGALK